MRKVGVSLAAFVAFAGLVPLSAPAAGQSLPSDPVAAVEGRWKGQWNDYEVEIKNGVVTLLKRDSRSYKYLPEGIVLARLNRNGHVRGDTFVFSGSQCLAHNGFTPPSSWKFDNCGSYTAQLRRTSSADTLGVAGLALVRWKNESATKSPERKSKPVAQTTPQSTGDTEQASAKAREQREAEWQAKVAAHEASVADYQQKVKAREAEIARQKREHAAAQEKARQAQEAHAAKMTMFERVLEEQRQRQREYEAAEARHRRCVNGNQQACADIKAGKPALDEKQQAQLASSEKPKTSDDDARSCVSRPVVSASNTFKGQTAAVVFNGCKTAVDVRVCLLRTGGWNCGVKWGLQPQDRWTHTSFETRGEIFWDARIAGSNEKLASPEGS